MITPEDRTITIGAAVALWFALLILLFLYDFGQRIYHQRRLKRHTLARLDAIMRRERI